MAAQIIADTIVCRPEKNYCVPVKFIICKYYQGSTGALKMIDKNKDDQPWWGLLERWLPLPKFFIQLMDLIINLVS